MQLTFTAARFFEVFRHYNEAVWRRHLNHPFAAMLVAGAAAFAWHGIPRRQLEFKLSCSLRTLTGVALMVFSLVGYPAWAIHAGHRCPSSLLCCGASWVHKPNSCWVCLKTSR
jgi:hypothetical protein